MKKVGLPAVVAAVLLTGCAGGPAVRLQADSVSLLTAKKLHVVRERPDPFMAISRTKAMFGALGIVAAAETGKSLVKKISMKDPSHELEDRLADYVIKKYGLAGRGETLDFVSTGAPSDIVSWARKNKLDGLVLDVETRGWQYIYNYKVFGSTDYFVKYTGLLTLTDLQSGKVLSRYGCTKDSNTPPNGKLYHEDELLANNGEVLKKLFATITDACVEEFKNKAL